MGSACEDGARVDCDGGAGIGGASLEGSGAALVAWYRESYGREPSLKVKRRAEELDARLGDELDEEMVAFDGVPVEVIEKALGVLGLGAHLARVAEEVERSHAVYQSVLNKRGPSDASLRRWQKALEVHRQLQKSDDCVAAAEVMLRVWVKQEFEPMMRKIRAGIGGKELGVKMRERLLKTTTPAEWSRVWDRGLEEQLRAVNPGE